MSSRSILVKSASKWEFLLQLSLDYNNPSHRDLYWHFKNDAISVYNQLLAGNRSALRPGHAKASPPFAANQFTDEAFLEAVRKIYDDAGPTTRPFYDQGRLQGGNNWVIRWVLYHVCRYRDGRNSKKAEKAISKDFHDDDNLDGGAPGPRAGGSGAASKKNTPYYDAARDGYRTVR